MLINLTEKTHRALKLGVKIDPQNFESYFAPKTLGKKRQKAHQTKALANRNTAACKYPDEIIDWWGLKSFQKFGQ